jgi:hypothetical protein
MITMIMTTATTTTITTEKNAPASNEARALHKKRLFYTAGAWRRRALRLARLRRCQSMFVTPPSA